MLYMKAAATVCLINCEVGMGRCLLLQDLSCQCFAEMLINFHFGNFFELGRSFCSKGYADFFR